MYLIMCKKTRLRIIDRVMSQNVSFVRRVPR